MDTFPFKTSEFLKFLKTAANATYVGGGEKEKNPQRPGFIELRYTQGDFEYRDSYTGFHRSWGTETVRFKDKPVWISLYGGGMTEGNEDLALSCFTLLKKAFNSKSTDSLSFRGPDSFKDGNWEYSYKQEGSVSQFSGNEEIKHLGKTVFTHKIIGGFVVDKS